jgi:ABC-type transport system substrate-binding protein
MNKKSVSAVLAIGVLSLVACNPPSTSTPVSTSSTSSTSTTSGYNNPDTLAAGIVQTFNENRAQNGTSLMAVSATCISTGPQVFDCMVKFDNGTQQVHAFSVSVDGNTFMSKNS